MNKYLKIIEKFYDINRYSPTKDILEDFRQLKKEIFANIKYVIKFTFYEKNKGCDNYAFENEIKWLSYLQKYDCIPRLFATKIYKNDIYILMENIKGNSLDNLTLKEYIFIKKNFYKFKNELMNILDLLKKENLLHRDIRPHNLILLNNKNELEVKLIDFQYMVKFGEKLELEDNQKEHYNRVLKNIGDIYRNKVIELDSFENDRFAIEKIINEFDKKNIFVFALKKVFRWKS
jgi:serine/threonine protein kinase